MTQTAAPSVAPDERDEVGDGDPQRQDDRARHAKGDEADERGNTGDQADDQVADHVAADCAGGVGGDALGRGPSSIRDDVQRRPADSRRLAEEQEGQQRDRDERECCARARSGLLRTPSR